MSTRKGENVVKSLFGGSLYQQGRGFYVSLELLAILRGSAVLEQRETSEPGQTSATTRVLPPPDQELSYLRPTHDFARRLMAGHFEDDPPPESRTWLHGRTERVLRSMLIGLHAPVPGRRRAPSDWRKWHLYPYPADFIHYDALVRKGKISVERDSYRGGGGLAHRILRTDTDIERLVGTRARLRELLADSSSALGELARALANHDTAKPEASATDKVEADSQVLDSPWIENLRAGVHRLLRRGDITNSKRIEAIMHWVPYCIARHQQYLAYAALAPEPGSRPAPSSPARACVVDCQAETGPIRELARRHLTESLNAIYRALEARVRDEFPDESEALLGGSQKWRAGPRTFFATTGFAVGAVNAATGLRHFTLGAELLEAIVLATIEGQLPFESFCTDVLHDQLRVVADHRAAQLARHYDVDQTRFERNGEALAQSLLELGLLERYSDMTRMVGVRP